MILVRCKGLGAVERSVRAGGADGRDAGGLTGGSRAWTGSESVVRDSLRGRNRAHRQCAGQLRADRFGGAVGGVWVSLVTGKGRRSGGVDQTPQVVRLPGPDGPQGHGCTIVIATVPRRGIFDSPRMPGRSNPRTRRQPAVDPLHRIAQVEVVLPPVAGPRHRAARRRCWVVGRRTRRLASSTSGTSDRRCGRDRARFQAIASAVRVGSRMSPSRSMRSIATPHSFLPCPIAWRRCIARIPSRG